MDWQEATQLICSRVQALDAENVSEIVGWLLMQSWAEEEILRLALASETVLQTFVSKAQKELGLVVLVTPPDPLLPAHGAAASEQQHLAAAVQSLHGPGLPVFTSSSHRSREEHGQQEQQGSQIDFEDGDLGNESAAYTAEGGGKSKVALLAAMAARGGTCVSHLPQEDKALLSNQTQNTVNRMQQHQQQQLNFQKQKEQEEAHAQLAAAIRQQPSSLSTDASSTIGDDFFFGNPGTAMATNRITRSPSSRLSLQQEQVEQMCVADPSIDQVFAWKPCLYFAKGYCKHGSSCRFLHGTGGRNHGGPSSIGSTSPQSPGCIDRDATTTSGTLQRLQEELYELLKGRRTPVSIASLPQLYYERFGKSLQAEGYLTESQRHGKAGYSLTKLLARLKDTVALIDRPHGQHAVVLAEDAHKHLGAVHSCERDESSRVNNSSTRQIYLTFPADSTFTEEEVSSYFRGYGPVQDVRIPYQQKRMFGFVTFQYASTVKTILLERNPHFICNARVLVKPYREKKQLERMKYGVSIDPARSGCSPRHENDESIYQIAGGKGAQYRCWKESDVYSTMQKLAFEDAQLTEYQLEAERLRMTELQLADVQRLRMDTENFINVQMQQSRYDGVGGLDFLDGGMLKDEIPLFYPGNSLGSLVDGLPIRRGEEEEDCESTLQSNVFGLSVNSNANNASSYLASSLLSHQLFDSCMETKAGTNPLGLSITSVHQQQQKPMNESGPQSRSGSYGAQGRQSLFSSSSTTPVSVSSEHDLTCPICLEYFSEPVELDCSHTFCEPCISQVMRVNKEECPICRRHVGVRMAKYLEMRDTNACLQSVLRGVQSCW